MGTANGIKMQEVKLMPKIVRLYIQTHSILGSNNEGIYKPNIGIAVTNKKNAASPTSFIT